MTSGNEVPERGQEGGRRKARTRRNFRPGDLTAAVNAVQKAGCIVRTVKIDPHGNIAVVIENSASTNGEESAGGNSWDNV